MSFTAKDVQALRQATGAGMMDAKKALEANDGDMEEAKQWLREKGLAASAKRDDRENTQGVVALVIDGNVGAMVKLKSETDFVAGSDQFKAEAETLARLVIAKGEAAVAERNEQLEDLKIVLKEKIELGEVVRIEAAPGNVIDSYLHIQGGRGVNGVLVEMSGASQELAHDVAVHVGFARPKYLNREDVPADVVEKERQTLEAISRNEGKPEAALPKIIEGRINGFFKDVALVEQPYAKDDKLSVKQFIGSASIVRFAQVEIG
ncbi:MAG: translation elongation factor Ts [Actinobacteria bacterium]|jgi:elongation factor Ts|nr:translation elongation factor Ts [Actinomycetota bacterium]